MSAHWLAGRGRPRTRPALRDADVSGRHTARAPRDGTSPPLASDGRASGRTLAAPQAGNGVLPRRGPGEHDGITVTRGVCARW